MAGAGPEPCAPAPAPAPAPSAPVAKRGQPAAVRGVHAAGEGAWGALGLARGRHVQEHRSGAGTRTRMHAHARMCAPRPLPAAPAPAPPPASAPPPAATPALAAVGEEAAGLGGGHACPWAAHARCAYLAMMNWAIWGLSLQPRACVRVHMVVPYAQARAPAAAASCPAGAWPAAKSLAYQGSSRIGAHVPALARAEVTRASRCRHCSQGGS